VRTSDEGLTDYVHRYYKGHEMTRATETQENRVSSIHIRKPELSSSNITLTPVFMGTYKSAPDPMCCKNDTHFRGKEIREIGYHFQNEADHWEIAIK
jgi:hypothetical protein